MYTEELIKAGLKEKEALIYDLLLKSDILPVNEIIKVSKLKRGIVYKTLHDLKEKGLIKELNLKKKLHYQAEHPFKLSEIIDQKLNEAQVNHNSLSSVLPLLISTYKSAKNNPGVKIYEGIEGVKSVYMDTLNTGKTIYAMLDTNIILGDISKWLATYYGPERAKRKIWADVIINQGKEATTYVKRNEDQFRETRAVSSEEFIIGIELNIYGGKVAFINFGEKPEELFAIVIENPLIYSTLKTMFLLAWKSALKN